MVAPAALLCVCACIIVARRPFSVPVEVRFPPSPSLCAPRE